MKVNSNRIAIFLATSGQSGVDRSAKNLIPALARRGYEVDLLKVRKHGPNLGETPQGVRVVELGSSHVYSSIPQIVRYLRRERPAVLFAGKDRVNRAALFSYWLARISGIRLVFWVGTPVSQELAHRSVLKRWSHRFWMRIWYRFPDEIVVDSPGVADDLRAYAALGDKRMTVVPHAVIPRELLERSPVVPDHPWLTRKELPVVLGAGELSGGKDHPTLIRAFARVRADRPCRLIILGKGKLLEPLRQLAAELGVGGDVDFPGYRSDIYAFMAHADIFVLTSLREGLSFVLIEALACGTPVVSTDCPVGPRAVLQGGRYGPLVPVGDVNAVAAAINQVLDSPPDNDYLKQAARGYEINSAAAAWLRAVGLPEQGQAAAD